MSYDKKTAESKDGGKGEKEREGEKKNHLQVSPATRQILVDSDFDSADIFSHGYFPKEIARFLSASLRDSGIPCEIGYDRALAESDQEIVFHLKNKYNDPRPFYFVSFPIELYNKVKDLLAGSSYPLPENVEADRFVKQKVLEKKKKHVNKEFRKRVAYLIVLLLICGGIYAIIWFSSLLLD